MEPNLASRLAIAGKSFLFFAVPSSLVLFLSFFFSSPPTSAQSGAVDLCTLEHHARLGMSKLAPRPYTRTAHEETRSAQGPSRSLPSLFEGFACPNAGSLKEETADACCKGSGELWSTRPSTGGAIGGFSQNSLLAIQRLGRILQASFGQWLVWPVSHQPPPFLIDPFSIEGGGREGEPGFPRSFGEIEMDCVDC